MGKLKIENEKLRILGCKKILAIIVFFVGGLCCLQVLAANRLVGMSVKVKAIENDAAKINKENNDLQNEISQKTSLDQIKRKAQALGLAKNISYIFLTSPVKIAFDKR